MDTFWAYTATFLTFLGMWAAGKKIPWAWLPNIVAQLCWIAWVIHTEMWDVMLSSVNYPSNPTKLGYYIG